MTLTAFPDGVSSFGVPLPSGAALPMSTEYRWVSSVSGLNGNDGLTPETPWSTLDYAVGKMTANINATVIAMPGHVETVTAAAGLALDVAGINLVGIGRGTLRPKINFTTAVSASVLLTAANVYMENFLFTGGIDALTNPVHVQASDFWLHGCEWQDVTGQATDVVLTTAAADRLKITDYTYSGAAAAGTNAGIAIVGGDGHIIDGVYADGNFAVGFLDIRTTATTNLQVRNWLARTRNAADVLGVDTITGSTGVIGPNLNFILNDNAANFASAFSGATFYYHGPISIANLAGEIGAALYTGTTSGFKTVSTNA